MIEPRPSPLDREEAELAARLRRLPDAQPGPSIDAAILAAARKAPPRRSPVRRPWVWSLGTAAAAVLALATLMRMQHEGLEPLQEAAPPARTAPAEAAPMLEEPPIVPPEAASGPIAFDAADSPAAETTAPPQPALDRIEVSGSRVRAEPAAPAPEPSPIQLRPRPPAAPPAVPAPSSSPAPSAFPVPPAAPPPPPATLQAPALREAPRPAAGSQRSEPARESTRARRTESEMAVPAPVAGKAAPDQAHAESDEAVFRQARELIAAGDEAGARELLKDWLKQNPGKTLPEDLQALVESS